LVPLGCLPGWESGVQHQGMALKVLISAGEVSGDQHLARVVRALKIRHPDAHIRGMAGKESQQAGAGLDVDCYRSGAAMGFLELGRSLTNIISSFRTMAALVRDWKPDVLVLVDYPDFNLRLAKVARKHGVKVLYYIPPKVWAWRSGRVKQIRRLVDRVAAIFPFEPEFYERHGYSNVTYVGHPLAETIKRASDARERENTILLLPGSRRFEVERLLEPMLRCFGRVRERHTDLRAVVLLAPNMEAAWAQKIVEGQIPAEVLTATEWRHGEPLAEMRRARVGVLKSGTCNLEGAIAGLPFVCVYAGTWIAKVVLTRLVALSEYSPVNIIKAHTVRELMEPQVPEDILVSELERIIGDGRDRQQMIADLGEVRDLLFSADSGEGSGATVSERVAEMIVSLGRGENRAESGKVLPKAGLLAALGFLVSIASGSGLSYLPTVVTTYCVGR
jgi:lipid-A-disaccharide synthase